MHSKIDRREVIRNFKEFKPLRGAFAVRCTATGRIWVGASPNLGAVKNRSWFSLRHGSHPNKTLQEEWRAEGESAFRFEILEKLDDDVSPLEIGDLLKEKTHHWVAELDAQSF